MPNEMTDLTTQSQDEQFQTLLREHKLDIQSIATRQTAHWVTDADRVRISELRAQVYGTHSVGGTSAVSADVSATQLVITIEQARTQLRDLIHIRDEKEHDAQVASEGVARAQARVQALTTEMDQHASLEGDIVHHTIEGIKAGKPVARQSG